MNTLILGVGGFLRDYNCALIDTEKKRVSICEAERLSRRKHHIVDGPKDVLEPIEKVCRDLGVKPRHIEQVAFGHTDHFKAVDWIKDALGAKKSYHFIDHHLSHAAAGFFSSGFQEALILSMDGFGDGASALLAHGKGNDIEILERIDDANSIGLEFTRATYHLGLGGYGSEGKTQGLAPYGEPVYFDDYMKEIDVTTEGRIILSDKLKGDQSQLTVEGGYLNSQILSSPFLNEICPRRINPEPYLDIHKNIAASIQKVIEEIALKVCEAGQKRTGCKALVLTGGVTMNSSLNGRVIDSGLFDNVFPLPMASDRGIGLGAALSHLHQGLGEERFFKLDSVFYGESYSDRRAAKAMKKGGLRVVKGEDIVEVAAQALVKGDIVGWFQDGAEMGARALGNRSIIGNPTKAEMKDIINERVKHREWFRPFAPAALEESANDYFIFDQDEADLSCMTFTVAAKDKAATDVPAVVHVDKTARLQIVRKDDNRPYAKLIRRFGELTGTPVVLNTSFNDMGEPIVETPEDAVKTFLNADMDVLCIGNVIGFKK